MGVILMPLLQTKKTTCARRKREKGFFLWIFIMLTTTKPTTRACIMRSTPKLMHGVSESSAKPISGIMPAKSRPCRQLNDTIGTQMGVPSAVPERTGGDNNGKKHASCCPSFRWRMGSKAWRRSTSNQAF